MSIWVADVQEGLFCLSPCAETLAADAPCALCACKGRVWCATRLSGALFDAQTRRQLLECTFPPAVARLEALPDALFALSGDADSVSRLCPETGRLLACARAGCYPRDMCLSPCGRMLAIAAGTEGALMLMDACSLATLRKIPVPGVATCVSFFAGGLALLCAAGDNELHTLLYTVSTRGVLKERLSLPGAPGALCALPGGGLCVGCADGLFSWRPDGRLTTLMRCLLPVRARGVHGAVLVADIMAGRALRVPLSPNGAHCLLKGREVADIIQIENAASPFG